MHAISNTGCYKSCRWTTIKLELWPYLSVLDVDSGVVGVWEGESKREVIKFSYCMPEMSILMSLQCTVYTGAINATAVLCAASEITYYTPCDSEWEPTAT